MIFVLQSVRIYKMCPGRPKVSCLFIHLIHECLHTSGYMLCDCNGTVIPRIKKQSIQQISQRKLISCLKSAYLLIFGKISRTLKMCIRDRCLSP